MKHSSSENRFAHLYRNRVVVVVACALSLFTTIGATAQRKKPTGPRAVAVVTWNGDDPTPTPTTSVLTPVAILVDGRYYDAQLYQAQPQPLAVDSGVIYDVLKDGEAIGTFGVGSAREHDGTWYGTGVFDAKSEKKAQDAKAPPAKAATPAVPEDDRPKLRRGAPPPPAPKEQTDEVLKSIDRDPERPMLHRKTEAEKKAQAAPQKEFVLPQMHMLVAVSDAGGPEPRPFTFHAKADEVEKIRASMEKLARAELDQLRKVSKPSENTGVFGKKERLHGPHAWPPLQLQNAKLGIFDVNIDNAPIVIYSATAQVDGMKKYITVAAWEEIDGSMRRVFAQVTDDNHLDVYPRLEVIDAVDSGGSGRGELLFRAYGDQGSRFVLYHAGPDSLKLIFDSAKGESS